MSDGLPELPSIVKGGIADYPVVITKLASDRTGAFTGPRSQANPELQIEEELPADFRWQTFFHELIHMIEMEWEFELFDEADDSDVNRLATGLYATFRRNRWKLPGE